jgi:tetratricopeptide (TPR) repeat protein
MLPGRLEFSASGYTVQTPPSFGAFEVRREMGRGAGGIVFEVHDAAGRPAVLKLYTAAPQRASAAIARLLRDAVAAGQLGHPNITPVLASGLHEGRPWVATEPVEGVSLRQVCRSRSPWPIERILDIWRQLCEGLAHAHREGVLHLDLKPADVLVTPTGEVRLLDFGAWHLKALEAQGPGPAEEGLHYRAPEVLAGRRPDRRADVFAVGAIVYELVARRRAFPGDTSTDVIRGISHGEPDLACLPETVFSPGLEKVLGRCLARPLESRLPSFEEVHAELVQLVRDAAHPEHEALVTALTQARAEGRLEAALEAGRRLLELDGEDEWARRTLAEIESAQREREVDELVGLALSHAADGEIEVATQIAEKIERLAPWSPRYLQLQVYLDEEKARQAADRHVAEGREQLREGRHAAARAAARDALAAMPGHPGARRLLAEADRRAPSRRRPRAVLSFDPEPEPAGAPSDPAAKGEAAPDAAAPDAPAPEGGSEPRQTQAALLAAAALRHFLKDEHRSARQAVEKALALDPGNPRALELRKILSVLG